MGSTRFRHVGLSDFAFVDGGKTIVSLGADPALRYWDPETGRQSRSPISLKGNYGRLALSRDGKFAASCSRERITVWEVATGKEFATFAGPKADPGAIDFSPDGKMLCVASWDCRLTVWDWKAGKEQVVPIPQRSFGMDSTFHGHFSPDGKHFAGGGGSGQSLCMFETTTWSEEHRFMCNASTSTFTLDSKQLIVCSMNNDAGGREVVIRVFDVATGKEVAKYPLGLEDANFSLAVSPDGRVLGCGCSDRSCLLDLTTGKILHKLTGRPWGLGFSPDGKTFAATEAGTHLRLWDVQTGKERHEQPGNFGPTLATATSPNGRLVAAADWLDRAVHVWDTKTGKHVNVLPLTGDKRYTRDLSFSTDGRLLAGGLYEGDAEVWDVATGKEMRAQYLGERPAIGVRSTANYYSTRVLPDGRRVATLDQDIEQGSATRVTIWDIASGKPVTQWSFQGEYRGRAWSADGETLALVLGQQVALIDLETRAERAHLEGAAHDSAPPVMSPDGRLVAVRRIWAKGTTSTVGVYEVATGKLIVAVDVGWGEFALGADNRTLIMRTKNACGFGTSRRARKWPADRSWKGAQLRLATWP
jgi:WD40 repeat protein